MAILSAAKFILVGLFYLIVTLVGTGAIYEQVGSARASRIRPPGQMVDIGGRRIQMDCRGSGSPTVVLESGLDYMGSLSWAAVHDSIATTTRVCAYSRAGILWSDRSKATYTAASVATDLHAALTAAGERTPFVMVGHSIGGPYVTVFTSMYPTDVAGLVLVDPSHPDQFPKLEAISGMNMKPMPGQLALGVKLRWTGVVRMMADAPVNTPESAAKAAKAFMPRSLKALLHEVRGVDSTLAAMGRARTLGDRPLVVLSAMKGMSPEELKMMGLTAEQGEGITQALTHLHDDEATWSTRGTNELVPDAGHYIQLDRPAVVVAAVRRVVEDVRTPRAVAGTK
jgi:pimeloyl-ACP methyl ester carboxylesterase